MLCPVTKPSCPGLRFCRHQGKAGAGPWGGRGFRRLEVSQECVLWWGGGGGQLGLPSWGLGLRAGEKLSCGQPIKTIEGFLAALCQPAKHPWGGAGAGWGVREARINPWSPKSSLRPGGVTPLWYPACPHDPRSCSRLPAHPLPQLPRAKCPRRAGVPVCGSLRPSPPHPQGLSQPYSRQAVSRDLFNE